MRQQTKQIGVLLATLALMGVLAFKAPDYFSAANLTDLFLSTIQVAIPAVGMTLIILTGQIDISIGSIFAICSVVMGSCAASGVPIFASALIACLLGMLCGGFNGLLTSYLRVPSIVATLATMVALRDALRWKTQGTWISGLPNNFQWLGLSPSSYISLCAIGIFILIALTIYGLRYLHVGRIIYATGSNPEAAEIAGINTRLIILLVFGLNGLLTGLAASINAVRFNQIPSNLGLGLEMKVIAAVAIGGAEITGGSASIVGTMLGVLLLGCISSALTFLHISIYWEKAIQGAIILIAVVGGSIRLYRKQNASALAH